MVARATARALACAGSSSLWLRLPRNRRRRRHRFVTSVRCRRVGRGPRRLAIDVPLLVGGGPFRGRVTAGAGLTDLRLFDPNGQELQYLLVSNPPEQPVWRSAPTLAVAAVETPTSKTSGFEIDLGQPIVIDRFRVDGITPPFLKRVRLEGSGDRARWTLLVDEGTLFDLPAERLVQTELAFRPGAYRYVRVTWDDTRSGRLPKPDLASAREVRNVDPAASAHDGADIRAATERAGPRPVPRPSARGAPADRGPRRRHRWHAHPARGDSVRAASHWRAGRPDTTRRGHVEARCAGRR